MRADPHLGDRVALRRGSHELRNGNQGTPVVPLYAVAQALHVPLLQPSAIAALAAHSRSHMEADLGVDHDLLVRHHSVDLDRGIKTQPSFDESQSDRSEFVVTRA